MSGPESDPTAAKKNETLKDPINRYWDSQQQVQAAKLLPGQSYISGAEEMIVSVLGACISVCIRDYKKGIGGMNQFMLPYWTDGSAHAADVYYGAWAMEHLINEIIKKGGRRERLEVMVFGGGDFLQTAKVPHVQNVDFVLDYLEAERLPITNQDVGESFARKIFFYPDTGSIRLRRLHHVKNNTLRNRELDYLQNISAPKNKLDILLF